MKVFVFSLFLMFAFSFQGYSSNQTADKAENKENVETYAISYQEQERDCDAESLAVFERVMESTDGDIDAAMAAHEAAYEVCWNVTH